MPPEQLEHMEQLAEKRSNERYRAKCSMCSMCFMNGRRESLVTAAELVRAVEERGGTVEVAGDSLVIRPKRVLTADLVAALKARKADIIRYLQSETQADAQARAAGLVVLEPGGVYHTAPDRLHEVLVMREDARWIAWAGLYPPPHFNGPKDRPRKTWMLYKGKDLRAALAEAVRFAERVARKGHATPSRG